MKKLLRNTLSLAGADVGSRILGFAVTVYLGRVLGTGGFGLVGIGFAVLGYMTLLSSPGVHVIGTRDVAAGGGTEIASSVNSLRLLLSIVLLAIAVVLCAIVAGTRDAALVVAVISASALPLAWSPDWFFQGKEQLVPVSAAKISMYVVYLLLSLLLVRSGGDVVLAAAAYTLGNLAATLGLILAFRRMFGPARPVWLPLQWRGVLKQSYPVGLSALLSQTVMNLPILVVAMLLTTEDAGLFNAAMKLIFFVLIIDRVFYAVFLPVASRLGKEAGAPLARVTLLGMRLVLLMTIPTAVLGIALSPALVALIFGKGYEGAGPVLACLLPYVVFTLMNTVFMTALIAVNRQKEYLTVMTWGTGLLVPLCVLLTHLAGIEGTAMSLSLGEAIMTGLFFLRARRVLGLDVARSCLPALISGMAMALVLFLFRGSSPALTVPAAVACFGLGIVLTRGLTIDEFRFLRERLV